MTNHFSWKAPYLRDLFHDLYMRLAEGLDTGLNKIVLFEFCKIRDRAHIPGPGSLLLGCLFLEGPDTITPVMVGAIYAQLGLHVRSAAGSSLCFLSLLTREVENEFCHHFWADMGPTWPLLYDFREMERRHQPQDCNHSYG